MYPELATAYDALLVESFLGPLTEAAEDDPAAALARYMQPDGIHPIRHFHHRRRDQWLRHRAGRGGARPVGDPGRTGRPGLGHVRLPRPSCFTAGCAIWSTSSSAGARGAGRARDSAARDAAYQLAHALRAALSPRHAVREQHADLAASERGHALDEGAAPGLADPAGPVSLRPPGRAEDPAGHARAVPAGTPKARRCRTGSNGPSSIPTAGWRIRASWF
jgi:hypothetical protein